MRDRKSEFSKKWYDTKFLTSLIQFELVDQKKHFSVIWRREKTLKCFFNAVPCHSFCWGSQLHPYSSMMMRCRSTILWEEEIWVELATILLAELDYFVSDWLNTVRMCDKQQFWMKTFESEENEWVWLAGHTRHTRGERSDLDCTWHLLHSLKSHWQNVAHWCWVLMLKGLKCAV